MTKFVTVRDMKNQIVTKVNWDRAKKLVKRGVAEKIKWWPNKNMVIKMNVPCMAINPKLGIKGINGDHEVVVYAIPEKKEEETTDES